MARKYFVVALFCLVPLVVAEAASSALVPGRSNAPDAVSVKFRAGSSAGLAAVDVRWDVAAVADSGGSGSAELITRDGIGVECLTPATGSRDPSGRTSAGGNATTTWTMSCGPITDGAYANKRPTTANIARVMILGDTATDKAHATFNGLEQVNVAAGGRTTHGPDLVGATFSLGVKAAGHTVDRAVYTFSTAITTLNSPGAFGVTPLAGGGESTIADSSGPFPGAEPKVSGKTVVIYFPAGTLKLATEAFVDAEGVKAAGDRLNQATAIGAVAGAAMKPPPPAKTNGPPTQLSPTPTPPTIPKLPTPAGPVAIDHGAAGTNRQNVTLEFLHVHAGTTKVEVSNSATMAGARTFAYVAGKTVAWRLASLAAGSTQTVFVRFHGSYGVKTAKDSIVVDLVAPAMGNVSATHYVAGTSATATPPPLYIAWHAGTDRGTGIRFYAVRASRDGGAYATVARTTQRYAYVRVTAGRAYRFEVTAVDRAGNTSKPVLTAARRVTVYPASSPALTYTGAWKHHGTVRSATAKGASVSFSFTGSQFVWVAPTSLTHGSAVVTIDNKHVGSVSLYLASDARRMVFARMSPASGTHKVSIVVEGTRGHPRVDVMAFLVVK